MGEIANALLRAGRDANAKLPTNGAPPKRPAESQAPTSKPATVPKKGNTRRSDTSREARSRPASRVARQTVAGANHLAREVVTHPTSFASEQYRQLALRVSEALEIAGLTSVLMTSATRGEGKSTTASNLALAAAGLLPDSRIALVELDLRGPVIAEGLGLIVDQGIAQVLMGDATLESVIVPTTRGQLDIIPSKPEPTNAHDLFSGPALPALWHEICDLYDIVIVDGPPALGFSDTAQLLRLADRCVVVARPGVTRMNAIEDAVAEFPSEKLLGVVTNASVSRRHAVDAYGQYYGSPPTQDESEEPR